MIFIKNEILLDLLRRKLVRSLNKSFKLIGMPSITEYMFRIDPLSRNSNVGLLLMESLES